MRKRQPKPSRIGVLLLDAQWRLVHYNAEAANILGYPKKLPEVPSLDAILPATRLNLAKRSTSALPSTIEFTSGRRRYLCRAFRLDFNSRTDDRSQPRILLVLDRQPTRTVDEAQRSDEFQLTSRERETVSLLIKGRSSKEIADEMSISPSTVKTFLKLVMIKVGASNRTGIVAKILGRASVVALSTFYEFFVALA